MISGRPPSNGCESGPTGGPGYRTMYPLHVAYTGSQLGYAVRYLVQHPATSLVTIDIGANDVLMCRSMLRDHCTGPDFGRTLATVTANMDTILNALRDRAHYRGDLVVLAYYTLEYYDPSSVTWTQALNAALARPCRPVRRAHRGCPRGVASAWPIATTTPARPDSRSGAVRQVRPAPWCSASRCSRRPSRKPSAAQSPRSAVTSKRGHRLQRHLPAQDAIRMR